MKKKVMLLTLIISTFLLADAGFTFQYSTYPYPNEPNGFRDLEWGDSPTEDMIYHHTSPANIIYTRLNDKMHIGNTQFYNITYVFYSEQERFQGVYLYFKEKENFDLLKTICQRKFKDAQHVDEKPYKPWWGLEQWSYKLWWFGPKTIIVLEYDASKNKGELRLISTQIATEEINAVIEEVEIREQKEIEKSEEDW